MCRINSHNDGGYTDYGGYRSYSGYGGYNGYSGYLQHPLGAEARCGDRAHVGLAAHDVRVAAVLALRRLEDAAATREQGEIKMRLGRDMARSV